MLDHHDDGDTRRLKRRIRHKPGVITVLFRQLFLSRLMSERWMSLNLLWHLMRLIV